MERDILKDSNSVIVWEDFEADICLFDMSKDATIRMNKTGYEPIILAKCKHGCRNELKIINVSAYPSLSCYMRIPMMRQISHRPVLNRYVEICYTNCCLRFIYVLCFLLIIHKFFADTRHLSRFSAILAETGIIGYPPGPLVNTSWTRPGRTSLK